MTWRVYLCDPGKACKDVVKWSSSEGGSDDTEDDKVLASAVMIQCNQLVLYTNQS